MPGPLGIVHLKIAPPKFNQAPTFTDLLHAAKLDTGEQSATIFGQLAQMSAIQAALDLDLGNMVGDLAGIDGLLNDLANIQWGSPEPDFQPITDYVTGQRDALTGGADSLIPIKPLPLVLPDGQAGVVFGGPPGTGGVAGAGAPQYVRHLPIQKVIPSWHSVLADGGSGPNPPFVSFGPVIQETQPNGELWWVYLVTIDPSQPGTFTGVAQYIVNITITGITGTLTRTIPFQVVVQ
jgi:hypothetical protein